MQLANFPEVTLYEDDLHVKAKWLEFNKHVKQHDVYSIVPKYYFLFYVL